MATGPRERPPAELLDFGESELVGVRFVRGAYAGANLIELHTCGVVCAASWRGAHVDLEQSGLFALALGLVVD